MKDFDFDEIDRAVNSVSSGKSVTDDKPVDMTDQTDSSESSKPVSQPPQSPPALAGRRSSGQFMDVVHPSSDMRRTPPPFKTPERPVSQNVEPTEPPVIPISPTTPDTEPQPAETVLPTPTIPNSGWTDSKSESEDDTDIDKISDDITNELDHKSDESLDTPFISGTKVEKRPLGAFSTGSSDDEPNTDNLSDLEEHKDNSLPDELQDKLLSIESNESKPGPEPQKETPESVEKPEVTEKVEKTTVETKPAVATSITQQYAEKPSTGDRDSGPIYDTNSYHKHLVSPIKKKSSWSVIIWILAILVVGVGAGVLVYYFVRPIL